MLTDSNVLIYSLSKSSPKCNQAQQFLREQKKIVIAAQNIFETYRVITHPRFPNCFSAKDALRALSPIVESSQVIAPEPTVYLLAFELAKKYAVVGNEIFDTYLVATALGHGIKTIATDNVKHFQKYTEISVYNPFILT